MSASLHAAGQAGGQGPSQARGPLGSQAEFLLLSDPSHAARQRMAWRDLADGFGSWRLAAALAWLDIRGRYRGSILGPLWLTLSTGVMVAALGVLYSTLFRMELHEYLPFLALSLVLWSYLSSLVVEACACYTSAEGTIRSIRLPYTLHALRVLLRNLVVLAHNLVIIAVVFAYFGTKPSLAALTAVPAVLVWAADGLAACLLLGALCARFRDIPPIIGNVMQIAFFVTPIIWKPELVGADGWWLPLNPFFGLVEIVREPLLGGSAPPVAWASALIYSGLFCAASWLVFARVRGRLAFWV